MIAGTSLRVAWQQLAVAILALGAKGWFVMVKDSNNSHPGNSLWGDGWASSWFDAGNPTKTTSTDYKKDCLPCHVPARATDWVYTSGYPALK